MKEDMRRTAGPLVKAHSRGIQVHVEQHVKDKMEGWCNAATSEVSGRFCVKLVDSVFYVYDVFLPEQMGSSGYTKYDGYAVGRLYGYLQRKYGMEAMGELKGWWHTHYTFGTFWSGTDDNQAQELATIAEDWNLSIVINQAGDWLARVDIVNPVPVMIDELDIFFVPNTKAHAKRDYERDIERWVKPFPVRIKKKAPIIVQKDPEPSRYVNVGGTVMPTHVFNEIMNCPCGDMTCSVCADNIKQYSRGILYDA